MQTIYPGAIQMLVPHDNVFWDCNPNAAIVCHGTASAPGATAQDIAVFFANDRNKASSHIIIGRDGTIVQCVLFNDGAGANGELQPGHDPFWDQFGVNFNLNLVTLSIEHVMWTTDNSDGLTSIQQQRSFEVIKWMIDNLGVNPANLFGHFSIDPETRHDCPGQQFPWQALRDSVAGNTTTTAVEESMIINLDTPGVANFFHGNDQNWSCTNGNVISYGMLGFYRSVGNSALCGLTLLGLPLTGEIYPQKGVVLQLCERGLMVYDPGKIVDNPPGSGDAYLGHITSGAGLQMIAKPLVDALQLQISALKIQLAAETQPALQSQVTALQAKLAQIHQLSV
jgi:N-acetylmuramoyl-L-alanine amidase